MPKYRVKTSDVDAWQWDGLLPASWDGAPEWIMRAWREGRVRFDDGGDGGIQRMFLATLDRETWIIAEEGCWVVRYEDSSLAAVSPGRFAEKFEEAPTETLLIEDKKMRVLNALREAWERRPDVTLTELLGSITLCALFYVHGDALEQRLREFVQSDKEEEEEAKAERLRREPKR